MVAQRVCRHCGAENPAAFRCWLCGGATPLGRDALSGAELPAAAAPRKQPTFSLASLMLTIAGLAVLFGVFRLFPGIALLLLILATPAVIRTTRFEATTPLARWGVFASTLGITIAVVLAAIGAFFVVCISMIRHAQWH